jgi:hypothetical protein
MGKWWRSIKDEVTEIDRARADALEALNASNSADVKAELNSIGDRVKKIMEVATDAGLEPKEGTDKQPPS